MMVIIQNELQNSGGGGGNPIYGDPRWSQIPTFSQALRCSIMNKLAFLNNEFYMI